MTPAELYPNIQFQFVFGQITYFFSYLYLKTNPNNLNSNSVKLHYWPTFVEYTTAVMYILQFQATHSSKNIRTVFKPLSLLTVELLLTVDFRLQISVFKWFSSLKLECGY